MVLHNSNVNHSTLEIHIFRFRCIFLLFFLLLSVTVAVCLFHFWSGTRSVLVAAYHINCIIQFSVLLLFSFLLHDFWCVRRLLMLCDVENGVKKIKNGNNNIGAHRFQMCCVNTCTRFRFRCFRCSCVRVWDLVIVCVSFVFSLLESFAVYFSILF